ncbi:unnamed protein product, partial [Effrenium voratum]
NLLASQCAAMAQLPLVKADFHELKDWLEPREIQEVLERQPRFIRPDMASLKRTVLGVILPACYFLARILPRAKRYEAQSVWPTSAVCSAWAFLSVFALAAASCRNPGVVPQAATPQPMSRPARYVVVNGVQVKQKWCATCRVFRPLRSKHCSLCDRCVFRFDHHCTWLGNCVGLGNYRSFLLLVVASTAFFGHSTIITFKVLWRTFLEADPRPVLRAFAVQNCLELLYAAYAISMFFVFGVLILYHSTIIAINLTTNEHVRDYYLYNDRNPFDQTCMENYHQVFCAPYGRPRQDDHPSSTVEPV